MKRYIWTAAAPSARPEQDCQLTDQVEISGLRAHCIIGVDENERLAPQPVEIDIVLDVDLAAAGASDDLADAVDYRSLTEAVVANVESSSFLLIEALATRSRRYLSNGQQGGGRRSHAQEARRVAEYGLRSSHHPAKAAEVELRTRSIQPRLPDQVKARTGTREAVDVVWGENICRSSRQASQPALQWKKLRQSTRPSDRPSI